MKIVIDKENLISFFTVNLYALAGGNYEVAKETAAELIEKMTYTPLPEKHGRLIDADALEYYCDIEKCVQNTGMGCNQCQYHTITEYEIDESPTIIEADKDGKTK